MNKNKKGNDFFKLVAIISMLVDHIGFVFFPQALVLHLVGRLAFPVFAWSAAQGYIYTSNLKNYLKRLFIFALISQIPYFLVININKPNVVWQFNIIFTLILGILLIYFIDKKKYYFSFLVFGLSFLMPVDYGIYGILLVFFFWWLKNMKIYSIFVQGFISLLYYKFILAFSVFTTFGIAMVLYFPNDKIKIHLPRYLFYWFYPIHLLILYFLSFLI